MSNTNLFQQVISDPKFDPYDIIKVKPNFSMKQLTKQYHKKALRYHPDKGGDALKYNIVKYAYKLLSEEHALRKKAQSVNGFREMKANADRFREAQMKAPQHSSDRAFNINRFNQTFNENPLEFGNKNDGYKDWIDKNEAPEVEENTNGTIKYIDTEKFNGKFNKKQRRRKKKNQIVVYKEPEASYSTKLKFAEVDLSKPKNFNQVSLQADMNYRDFKDAYTNADITDIQAPTRKTFRSVDELQNDRSTIDYEMSESDKMKILAMKQLKKREEDARTRRIYMQNKKIESHFNKVNSLLLR